MGTYLIRCAETGREQQARLGKLRRDLTNVIDERLPGARVETAPGRVIVESEHAETLAVLAALPGVGVVSACERVAFEALAPCVVGVAERVLAADRSFAIRIRRGGEKGGTSARVPRLELARQLASAIVAATGAQVDLTSPDVEIGIELRGDEAFVFDHVVEGVDRTGPVVPVVAPVGAPKFVADQMLGTLAARLRLLGYDTLTVFDIADSEVTRLAAADGRILLTKDGPLSQTRAVTVHFVVAKETRAQLAEVISALALTPDPERFFTRCTLCNTAITPVEEAAIASRLPENVRDKNIDFHRCDGCDHLYWRGAHVDRILAELAELTAA